MYKMPFADFDPARFMADFKIPAFDAEAPWRCTARMSRP